MTGALLAVRAPAMDDVPAITAMMNARGLALHGSPEMSEEELRGWFTLPSMDLERDVRIAVDASGRIVAYADLGDQAEDGTRLWIDLRAGHEAAGEAATEALLDAMESRARERAVPGAVLRAVAHEKDDRYRRRLEQRGYRVIRSSFRMEIEFDGPPAAPVAPAGVEIRPVRAGEEERRVYETATDAFGDGPDFVAQPYEEFLHWARSGDSDPALWWAAAEGDSVVGVCLCRTSAQGDPDRGWVETLGVRRPWRGRGLGRALLLTALGEFHRRGQAGGALSVDAANTTGAVRLYESVGMRAASRHDIYERPLDG